MAIRPPGDDWNPRNRAVVKPALPASSPRAALPGAVARPGLAPKPRRMARTTRFLLAGGFAAVLIGAIIYAIVPLTLATPLTVVVVAPPNTDSLAGPDNLAGVNAAAAFAGWASARSDQVRFAATPGETGTRDAWKSRLPAGAKSLLLSFTVAGNADAEGPYLWVTPPDAPGVREGHKLRVKEVLDHLAGLPAAQPKLLIFDVATAPMSLPHGEIVQDFARALQALDAEVAKVGGLAVICSAGPHERSWLAEHRRTTAFQHCWLEALKGHATKHANGRVGGAELFEDVRRETARWAQLNVDEPQTPILLPREEGPARLAAIELAVADGATEPPKLDPPGEPPAALSEAWARVERLARKSPAPDTANPSAWRDLLDTLLRWEALARLGATPATTAEVERRAAAGFQRLDDANAEGGEALLTALPYARAVGLPPVATDGPTFARLWEPPPGTTRAAEWARLKAASGDGGQALALAVTAQILTRWRTAAVTGDDLRQAGEVLAVIDGGARPAEAHFVRMLQRDLPATANWELVTQTVRLRALAEQVAWLGGAGTRPGLEPHIEQVLPWFRAALVAGDRERQLAQDLLLGGEPSTEQEARTRLVSAEGKYRAAEADAHAVATALQLRDRVACRLPYYAAWAAEFRGSPALPADKLLSQVEAVTTGFHKLDKELTRPAVDRQDGSSTPADLAAQFTATRAELVALEGAYQAEAAGLTNTVLQGNRHAIDGVLGVPFLPAEERRKLLGYARAISYQLEVRPEASGERPTGKPAGERALRDGLRWGRVAVALLGTREPAPPANFDALRDAGRRYGLAYRAMATDAAAKVAAAQAAPVAEAAGHYAEAARWERLSHPAAPLAPGETPTQAERRFRRHDLLLFHAARAIDDGWADVTPGLSAPAEDWYCVKSAGRLLAVAERLMLRGEANLPPEEKQRRLAGVTAARKLRPPLPTLRAAAGLAITDEPTWRFDYAVARPANVGYPVTWLQLPGLPFNGPAESQPRVTLREASRDYPQTFKIPDRGAAPTPGGTLTTSLLYRGHLMEVRTAVTRSAKPDLEVVHLPPVGAAKFLVEADESVRAGALTLLIDLSFSMNDPLPGGGAKKKLTLVHESMHEVLRGLPRGTQLSIAFFWGDGNEVRVVPLSEVGRLAMPIDWQGVAQVEEVMRLVESQKITPGANTPLVQSIEKVLSKGLKDVYWPKGSTGTRTLVALTDGIDNGGAAAARLLRILDNDAIAPTSLHLVLFGVSDDERKAANDDYGRLNAPGALKDDSPSSVKFWGEVNDVANLTATLKGLMVPEVVYRRSAASAAASKPLARLKVTLKGEGAQTWSDPADPDVYDFLRLASRQTLRLDAGDRASLRASRGAHGLALAMPRVVAERADAEGLPRSAAGANAGLTLTVPRVGVESRTGYCDAQLTAILEAKPPASPADLRVERPAFAWFDVKHRDGAAAPGLKPRVRVVNAPGWVAPAWTIDLHQWDRYADSARSPEVSAAWVSALPGAPLGVFPIARTGQPGDFATKPTADGVEPAVVCLGIAVEAVEGESVPDGDYLTARFRTDGRRVFLRPGDWGGTNQRWQVAEQHRYFDDPKTYTARFGPVRPGDRERGVELKLYLVEELLAAAEKEQRKVTLRFPTERLTRFDGLKSLYAK